MLGKIAICGNTGEGIRSDCQVSLVLTPDGGRVIELNSKVEPLYGQDILQLVHHVLDFFSIENIRIDIQDSGALPFVITARIEAALALVMDLQNPFLPAMLPENTGATVRDKRRFSRLYLPGNAPKLMINAGLHQPDGVILDLEDAVAPDKKHEARYLVRNALRALDFYGAERMVRINQVPLGLQDLSFVVPHHVNLILIPKCESAAQVQAVNERIAEIMQQEGLSYPIWLMPIVESALGLIKAFEIATAAENVVSLAIGLEDYTADLGTRRTIEGDESFLARSMVVNACRAAGIQPIDSVFSDINDMEALHNTVIRSKSLGFDGMGCIHPRQIPVIHKAFTPDNQEIERAMKIVRAFDEATAKGLGVVSLGSKMIDAPVVKRALKTIELAVSTGMIAQNWREV